MIQKVFTLLAEDDKAEKDDPGVSFNLFTIYLEEKLKTEQSLRQKFYEFLLQYFRRYIDKEQTININNLSRYPVILELLYVYLFPTLANEQETLWALSAPDNNTVFYATPAFYKTMAADSEEGTMTSTEEEQKAFYNTLNQVKYALVLERCYHVNQYIKEEVIYAGTSKTTGLPLYYSIAVDNRFVEVEQKEAAPHTATKNAVVHRLKKVSSLCEMETSIPLSSFSFKGFSIITATDITPRYALHKMRSAIIRHTPENFKETYQKIIFLLRALCGIESLQFGLLPFIKLNNQPVSFYESYPFSITINIARAQQIKEAYFLAWINRYFKNAAMLFYKDGQEPGEKQDVFFKAFAKAGIKKYALLPVHYNEELAGILEISTTADDVVDETIFSKLDAAMPILAQLIHNNQLEFKAGIDRIIKTNFTAVQPAVQWKFNEVALKYLRSRIANSTVKDIEPIRFEQVYPLYGAIDIRNSTVERNNALYKDMQFYFSFLAETLQTINTVHTNAVNDLLSEAHALEQQTGLYLSGNEEAAINHFMERTANFLHSFMQDNPHAVPVINDYFKALDPVKGAVYTYRRTLEKTIQLVNGIINKYLDQMQASFLESYPFYFEKFRTDGVEYDIYIGQSIAPQQAYKEEYLHQLRLWQLRSLADIARMVDASGPEMPVHLQTTQLIYVNANAIDISFRTDEKRFDVEGDYNVRYHVVKKRIDKVHIKDTGERLTKPDAIAIVFTQKSHEEEYMSYIAQLQQEGLLQSDARLFELEELQGVTGLKAIRVSVAAGA